MNLRIISGVNPSISVNIGEVSKKQCYSPLFAPSGNSNDLLLFYRSLSNVLSFEFHNFMK